MVVLPALSRPSTRMRASFSPKIDNRRETQSPIPAVCHGDQATTRPRALPVAGRLAAGAQWPSATAIKRPECQPKRSAGRQVCPATSGCFLPLKRAIEMLRALSVCWGGIKMCLGLIARSVQSGTVYSGA